jgi:hypothetical protein
MKITELVRRGLPPAPMDPLHPKSNECPRALG